MVPQTNHIPTALMAVVPTTRSWPMAVVEGPPRDRSHIVPNVVKIVNPTFLFLLPVFIVPP